MPIVLLSFVTLHVIRLRACQQYFPAFHRVFETLDFTIVLEPKRQNKKFVHWSTHKAFINGKSTLVTIGEGNAESFAFFCMHTSFHCACIVLFRPRNAIWSLSKAYQYVFKLSLKSWGRGAGISLNPSNFSLDKISYTIHISSMIIHLSNKYKNLRNSCWLDFGSFCHSLSGFSILLHKTSKIYFPIYTLFLQKQNFFFKIKVKKGTL